MPPSVALLLTTAFVIFLFHRDIRERPRMTAALWIPLLWILLAGSRTVSLWLGVGWTMNTPSDLAEGSPLDRVVFLSLELAGLFVLFRRRISWSTVLSRNPWLAIFLAYCALTILWSDFPFVAFKRWLKVLGHPIMVLILATEPDPREAVVRVVKRAAYVLVPFSILLIKYYPHLGRSFSPWSGVGSNTGVTTDKNELGAVCLVLGFVFFWHLVTILRHKKSRERRNELVLTTAFLCMIGWLLLMANSSTSLMSFAVGISVVVFFGLRFIDARHSLGYAVAGLLAFLYAESLFGVTDALTGVLGRDPNLSGRLALWADVLQLDLNPILGAGFETFWLGERIEKLWALHWWRPNQAHNGYLETYLNLGWIGVLLLGGWILSAFWRARGTILADLDLGRFRLGILAIVMVYNYTEAAFKGLHPIWLLFYIATIDYPQARPVSVKNSAQATSRPRLGLRAQPQRKATQPPSAAASEGS